MKFTNVRVPRENLLNRFADVQPDGQYVSSVKNPRTRHFPLFPHKATPVRSWGTSISS